VSNGSALGRLLKDWRGRRGLSQLALAVAARTTQRHLSFIESGRAAPSRDMVLRLGATLSLPLRQQNALLLAASYAAAWQEPDVSALSELVMPAESRSPVLPIHFRHGGTALRLFTTIATLGTPQDVTLEEIRIEFFFPMDEPTAQAFRSWANR